MRAHAQLLVLFVVWSVSKPRHPHSPSIISIHVKRQFSLSSSSSSPPKARPSQLCRRSPPPPYPRCCSFCSMLRQGQLPTFPAHPRPRDPITPLPSAASSLRGAVATSPRIANEVPGRLPRTALQARPTLLRRRRRRHHRRMLRPPPSGRTKGPSSTHRTATPWHKWRGSSSADTSRRSPGVPTRSYAGKGG